MPHENYLVILLLLFLFQFLLLVIVVVIVQVSIGIIAFVFRDQVIEYIVIFLFFILPPISQII